MFDSEKSIKSKKNQNKIVRPKKSKTFSKVEYFWSTPQNFQGNTQEIFGTTTRVHIYAIL